MPSIVKSVFAFAKKFMQIDQPILLHVDQEMLSSRTDIMHIGKEDIDEFCIIESAVKVYMR